MPAIIDRIDETVSIPDLLRAAPEVRSVLDRYGLRGCAGPAESVGFFARAHDVPVGQLLGELEAARRKPVVSEPPTRTDAIYRPFFKAGIVVVLTAGAVWGAYLLLRIAWTGSFRAAGLHEVNAHGHAQIFGWVGLFVMGFAYQAFPRFKHTTLALAPLAWASLGLMLAGLVGRTFGEPLADTVTGAGGVAVAAAWVEVVAVGLFVAVILATWRRAGKPLAVYDYYILSALGWFFVQAVFEAVYLRATLAAGSREELLALVATWQGSLREVQIHGFALLIILGVSQRILHHFYGLPAPNRALAIAALVVLNMAVAGEATALVLMRESGRAWAGVWYLSTLAVATSVVALVWNWKVFGRSPEPDRSLKFIRAAYVWLLVSLGMALFLPVYQFALLPVLAPASGAAQMGFSHAYYGAVRHAITVGFVSMMILGVSSRVVPTLNGADVSRLSRLWVPFVLLNLGCALRVTTQIATDLTASAFPLTGVSGVLEVTALAVWATHLWRVMAGRPRYRLDATTDYVPGSPIEGGHRVGDLLDRYPELLPTFIELGFRPLANPVLRRTVARTVSVAQACRHLGLDLSHVIDVLNRARTTLPGTLRPLPIVTPS
ncbi:MAG: NnrS family protein [Gemmataceae bacterium]